MPRASGGSSTGSAPPGRPGAQLWSRFEPVLLILSPPRSGSTVLARSFWQHPLFRWYVHEPYDRVYHQGADHGTVREAVSAALEKPGGRSDDARGVVVKEMTFQVGPLLPELAEAATLPVLVTIRDPRLSIWSRMRQREEAGQDPCFPVVESGWADLQRGLVFMRDHAVPYIVVEISRLRRRPATSVPDLCERLGLPFTPQMLSWSRMGGLSFGQLGGEQSHWYARVLASTGFQPPTEEIPDLAAFPVKNGMRAHVEECLDVYRSVLDDPRVLPSADQDRAESP